MRSEWELAMGNGQWAMGNGQWAMGNRTLRKYETFLWIAESPDITHSLFTIHYSPFTMVNFINNFRRWLNGLSRPSKQTNERKLRERGERIDAITFREVTETDISELAALHVKTWNQTYPRVLIPPTIAIREYQWRQQFKVHDGSWFCWLVINEKNKLIGFAKGKAYKHSDLPEFSGELNKIYLLRDYHRLGLGRKLLGYVARRFLGMGINNMVLFGTAQNPTAAFHEAMGGEKLFAKNGQFHGGFCWRDLEKLAAACAEG